MAPLRERVLGALRRSGVGARVGVLALAAALGATPEDVLASVMPELMSGAVYADPTGDGPGLTPREAFNE